MFRMGAILNSLMTERSQGFYDYELWQNSITQMHTTEMFRDDIERSFWIISDINW